MLKDLWRDKTSAGAIAAILNKKALPEDARREFTRNAVIGKINRLGLQGEGSLATRFSKSKKRKPRAAPSPPIAVVAATEPAPTDKILDALEGVLGAEFLEDRRGVELAVWPTIEEEVEIAVSDRVTLFHLGPGVCKWPIGDPQAVDFTFCGDACDVTRPYCETHHKIAYVPIAKFKTDPRKAYHR